MRNRTLILVALVLGALQCAAWPAAAQPHGPTTSPVRWELFPRPDTALARKDGNVPTSDDSLMEIVLDDRGVNFGSDGKVAVSTWKVYLPKSRKAADQLMRLPTAPQGEYNTTAAFVVHPDGQAEVPNSMRGGIIQFAGVFPGDLVYVGMKIVQSARRPGVANDFSMAGAFATNHPVHHVRFWVRYAAGRAPGLRLQGLARADSATTDGWVVRQWRAENVAPRFSEPAGMGSLEGSPMVLVSNRLDLDWLGTMCRGYLRQPAGPRLKALAAQLKAQARSRAQLLELARAQVAFKVGALRAESMLYDSLRALTPDEVLRRGAAGTYGKSVLLTGLLRQLGFQPAIALVEPRRVWREPFALIPEFVSPVVAVPAVRPTQWINPMSCAASSNRVEVPLQGLVATVVGPDRVLRGVTIPEGTFPHRGVRIHITGAVDEGGVIAGDMRISFYGCDADLWRSALQTGTVAQASEALQNLASQVLFTAETQEAKGEGFETAGDSASLTSPFRARDLMDRSADSVSLRLPSRPIPELEGGPRTTSRDLLRLFGPHEMRIELTLPPKWELRAKVDTASASGRYLRWTAARNVENGRLTFVRTVDVLKTSLPVGETEVFRAEQTAMERAFDRPVEFRVPTR